MGRSFNYSRLIGALVIGASLAFFPRLTSNLPEHGIAGSLKFGIQCLMLPGAAIGMIVSRNAHDISIFVVEIVNVLFYSGLLYAFFTAWSRRKGSS